MGNARVLLTLLAALAMCPSASAADVGEVEVRATACLERLADATSGVLSDERRAVGDDVTRAEAALAAAAALMTDVDVRTMLGRRARRVDRRFARLEEKLAATRALLDDAEAERTVLVAELESATRTTLRALRFLRGHPTSGATLREKPRGRDPIRAAGSRVRLRLASGLDGGGVACPDATQVTIDSFGDGTVLAQTATIDGDRVDLLLGPDAGRIVVTATACGIVRTTTIVNRGDPAALDGPLAPTRPPSNLTFADATPSYRVGETAAANAPTVDDAGPSVSFAVSPPLPAGLSLDTASGDVAGTPLAESPTATFTVTATNESGSAQTTIDLQVTPELPEALLELEAGFAAEVLHDGLTVPVKLAQAPDGRLFFNELVTGDTRVIGADGILRPMPFAHVDVLTGGERGLIGLVLAPDFATSGHVFVYAITPASGPQLDRGQVVRFTAIGDVGTDPTVIVDDLPAGVIQNGGDLQFGPDGMLYVSVGDTTDETLSQTDGSRAGRILRFTPSGGIPADNPIAGDPEWCRGLRNSFDLVFHPITGGLFASENGPTAHDELNFIQRDKNFEWGPAPPDLPQFQRGLLLMDWTPVIVPTGVLFLADGAFGPEFDDDLIVLGYDEADIRRMRLSGPLRTDLDDERPFAHFENEQGIAHKPLDAVEALDGSLLISTFTEIWRIRRY